MDWFDASSAPEEYQAVAWIADAASLIQGIGWSMHYLGLAYTSYQQRTYSASLLPLCCNFAWEFVYAIIYPPSNPIQRTVVTTWLVLNIFVVYFAIRFAQNEWIHAPLVQRHMALLIAVSIVGFASGHLALAATVGPGRAANWGAFLCFTMLCAGSVGQLLSRGSSRGASYALWLSRFIGSYVGSVCFAMRGTYWPEAFSWLDYPIVKWHGAICLVLDIWYPIILRSIRQSEQQKQGAFLGAEKQKAN
ncbi:fumitremorgin C monooxygenase [Penicillium sp. CMV-2018d]|nr:fumitremorgin C monooxygenase [Penicillium sp. CMV-2018d]